MKIRQGFVSNSSSSSFVIARSYLTEEQICALRAHCDGPVGMWHDTWNIYENEYQVTGSTIMRNNTPGECEDDLADWMFQHLYPMHLIHWEND